MLTLPAYAKVNLTLDILGALPDGYHELKSVMQALELHDTLEITSGDKGIEISSDSEDIPLGSENLVYKAAAILMRETSLYKSAHIKIYKRIPVAAGLGGGSADAAAALLGLNRFWGLGLSLSRIVELGARIGADVPFFVQGKTALAAGKGEKLSALPSPPLMGVVLVKPDFGVSTALVYKLFDSLPQESKSQFTERMVTAIKKADIHAISSNLGNDLEPVTAALHSEIREIKDELKRAGALGAEMSGSGPTVFGLTENVEKAMDLAEVIRKDKRTVIVTRFKD